MYEPDEKKLQKYRQGEEGNFFDWHAWLRDLTREEKKELIGEILESNFRNELSSYARQYYLHFCTDSEDGRVRELERDFVHAQIDGRPQEEISEIENLYYERAKELLRIQENTDEN